ncbi:potassium channel family protein [Sphingomonas arantia]|uniref:Potassium channel family protein n=1 Tax=Sphingomonas arantia TaxID=1460676 RepID=A0ABW4TZM8_9SPHN
MRQRPRLPPWVSLLFRITLALVLIGIALAGHWYGREGLRDNVDGRISFIDVLYFTTVTVTTVGFGDIVPVSDNARLFDTFIVTPIRLFVWLIFLGTAYDFVLKRTWERYRMRGIQRTLHDHVVVAGFSDTGMEAVRELIARGLDPARIVVVDESESALACAIEMGATTLEGDATRNAVLEAARIARAESVIVAAGRDDTAILIVLTARRLAQDVPISVIIRSDDNEPLAHQAGANVVINPASFAGLLLAGSTRGPHIADYMTDLAAHDGQVALKERAVTADEVGQPLTAITTGIGLRIYRDGEAICFGDPATAALQADDILVEVVKRNP